MRHIRLATALAAACVLLSPAAAQGQGAKRPDPDSPAGVEYQLPLEQARKNAANGGGEIGPGGGRSGKARPAPLFGAGVAPARVAARSGAGAGGGAGDGETDGSAASSGGEGQARDGDSTAVGAATLEDALSASDGDGGSATLPIAGIALAVLVLGALLGIFLRRALRHPGT